MGLQTKLHEWRQRNFPNANADEQFEGMIEEIGELAKVRLKKKQGIRSNLTSELAEKDAIADLIIFTMGYCSYRGWDIHEVVNTVAEQVMERDWIKYPDTGRPPVLPAEDLLEKGAK